MWTPNPGPQAAFLACPEYEVLYGGAAGSGKSAALLVDAAKQAHISTYRALLIRRSYPELRELIHKSREIYGLARPAPSYNQTERVWTWPSGARIEFGYMSSDDDAYRYQGQEYSYIGWDELTHYTEFCYKYLLSRVRSVDPRIKCRVRATTNPGGRGHNWVKARFIDPAPPLSVVRDTVTGQGRVFIPARLADNPHLAVTDYGARLNDLPDADRKALLDGDWDAYTGSVFSLERGIHAWTWAQFKDRTGHDRQPKEWTRFRVYDAGFARPFAAYWVAVDYEGRAYAYREWYGVATDSKGATRPNEGVRMEHSRIAERMADLERSETISTGWTGPDLFSAGTGDTTAGITRYEAYQKAGVRFTAWDAGPDSRKAKKAAVHERLWYERGDSGEVAEWPGLVLIVDPADKMTCHHALRTIPALEYDPARGGEDIDSDGEDHAYDALAAFCLMRPWKPKKPKGRESWRDRKGKSGGWAF